MRRESAGWAVQLGYLKDEPREKGLVWQTLVVEWTRGQSTDEKKPLEKLLR